MTINEMAFMVVPLVGIAILGAYLLVDRYRH